LSWRYVRVELKSGKILIARDPVDYLEEELPAAAAILMGQAVNIPEGGDTG
jgi:hypothetical protein